MSATGQPRFLRQPLQLIIRIVTVSADDSGKLNYVTTRVNRNTCTHKPDTCGKFTVVTTAAIKGDVAGASTL